MPASETQRRRNRPARLRGEHADHDDPHRDLPLDLNADGVPRRKAGAVGQHQQRVLLDPHQRLGDGGEPNEGFKEPQQHRKLHAALDDRDRAERAERNVDDPQREDHQRGETRVERD
jgi:hypothetical protein